MKINYKKLVKKMLKVQDIPFKKIEIKENNFPNYKFVIIVCITNYEIPVIITIEAHNKKEFILGDYKRNIKNQLIDELKNYKKFYEEEGIINEGKIF